MFKFLKSFLEMLLDHVVFAVLCYLHSEETLIELSKGTLSILELSREYREGLVCYSIS